MACPQHVLFELQNRGLIPTNVTPMNGSAHYYGHCSLSDDDGAIREWEEPNYGTKHSHDYKGFEIPQHLSINDHCGHMSEIMECDGVLWKLTRVIHSQPYCSTEECHKNIETLQQNHNVRLTVTEDDLSWYSNHSRLCIMVHNDPMFFRDFRRLYCILESIRILACAACMTTFFPLEWSSQVTFFLILLNVLTLILCDLDLTHR